ncbi:phage portal protein [Jeongeupia chitinilytica]|uniref:Phage portal protein n=1 Tax=Jeongeupia chitinilytica TaxID=1041641 RepID=A0ABQ3GYA4_9NEIS|nr:phage portal protein [Jeongeupia chitinilytica]GHD60362.1 phage portal protein [Jeongeupia chitinilytica]
MNVFDSIVGFFSPRAGLARWADRQVLDEVRRFDGAQKGRRTDGWLTPGTSANATNALSLPVLRNRARNLVDNNEWAAGAVRRWIAQAVGTGIVPDWGDRDTVDALWQQWAKVADADGGSFAAALALIARTAFVSGEVLIRIRPRKTSDGLPVPFQIQVLEPDYLDVSGDGPLDGGGYRQDGIEFDAIGRRVAYWLFDRHPGDDHASMRTTTSHRVPARWVIHHFEVLRPGQHRGVTRFAPVIMSMRDLGDYEDATLMRKKVEACIGAVITSTDVRMPAALGMPVDPAGETASGSTGRSGRRNGPRLTPGMMTRINPGESINFLNPTASADYQIYTRRRDRGVASGLGVTYEQLTGDYSQVNFSSGRMGRGEFRAEIQQYQLLCLIPQVCEAIATAFLAMARVAGLLRPDELAPPEDWTTPGWMMTDPGREVPAMLMQLDAGLASWGDACRAAGINPRRQQQVLQKQNDALQGLIGALNFSGKHATGAVDIPDPPDEDQPAGEQSTGTSST